MREAWKELPDALQCSSGHYVKDAREWEEIRRQEILELFRSYVYGRIPDSSGIRVSIQATDSQESEGIMMGQAVRKTVEVEAERNGRHFIFSFVVFIPKQKKKAPVFITICNRGIMDSDPSRDFLGQFWPAETLIARGYAAAVFRTQEVAPDYDEGCTTGFYRLFPEFAHNRPEDMFGAISAWSWAVSRIVDYIETDELLDAGRIAVVGHSRGGKTALWTAAQDQRIAMAAASCAGCSGDALSRGGTGERIRDITGKFHYWFCPAYGKYSGRESELPLDQHMLLSLIAPRLVYTSAKTRDSWADPEGQLESCLQAGRVYELYGMKGISRPEAGLIPDRPVWGDGMGHHRKTGGHQLDEFDWGCYLDFADARLSVDTALKL